ncbi:hypothetical protein AYO20_11518 [Fonsecaea nubica]|uniref:Uncharacterized protein n=1 Tax=Fonsecaea nubica TaxID=856822 RepID=A0A178BT87_9EURO|nr:hypothetical protein AYO20_11518 [Fonsecaea nubica]OAL20246.1 hypothetical protein AYO20_11518 [Fonsecaea nubica]
MTINPTEFRPITTRPRRVWKKSHMAAANGDISVAKPQIEAWSGTLNDFTFLPLASDPLTMAIVEDGGRTMKVSRAGFTKMRQRGDSVHTQDSQHRVQEFSEDNTQTLLLGHHQLKIGQQDNSTILREHHILALGTDILLNVDQHLSGADTCLYLSTIPAIAHGVWMLRRTIVQVITTNTYACDLDQLSAITTGVCHMNESQEEDSHQGLHAPSPPPVRSSSLGYISEPERGDEENRQGRVRRGRRRRSRSRSREDEQSGSGILRPGDEVTVIERHDPRPKKDYDWYDNGGMRVRVREISQ